MEFGDERVARLDADFGGPTPRAPLVGPNVQTAEEKREFAVSRRQRWFGYSA